MNFPLFASERHFVLFSYSVSHGLLLLRSGKRPPDLSHRIDVLFQDVRAMEMRCWLEGLIIEETDAHFIENVRSNAAETIEPGNKIYAIKSKGCVGFIVGGIFRTHEDKSEFFEPSKLIQP